MILTMLLLFDSDETTLSMQENSMNSLRHLWGRQKIEDLAMEIAESHSSCEVKTYHFSNFDDLSVLLTTWKKQWLLGIYR